MCCKGAERIDRGVTRREVSWDSEGERGGLGEGSPGVHVAGVPALALDALEADAEGLGEVEWVSLPSPSGRGRSGSPPGRGSWASPAEGLTPRGAPEVRPFEDRKNKAEWWEAGEEASSPSRSRSASGAASRASVSVSAEGDDPWAVELTPAWPRGRASPRARGEGTYTGAYTGASDLRESRDGIRRSAASPTPSLEGYVEGGPSRSPLAAVPSAAGRLDAQRLREEYWRDREEALVEASRRQVAALEEALEEALQRAEGRGVLCAKCKLDPGDVVASMEARVRGLLGELKRERARGGPTGRSVVGAAVETGLDVLVASKLTHGEVACDVLARAAAIAAQVCERMHAAGSGAPAAAADAHCAGEALLVVSSLFDRDLATAQWGTQATRAEVLARMVAAARPWTSRADDDEVALPGETADAVVRGLASDDGRVAASDLRQALLGERGAPAARQLAAAAARGMRRKGWGVAGVDVVVLSPFLPILRLPDGATMAADDVLRLITQPDVLRRRKND